VQSPVAEVLAVSAGRAHVSVASVACPRCAAGRGCGAGLLAASARNTHIEIRVSDEIELAPGDQVTLSVAGADLLRAAACAYGLPLAGTVGALAFGQTMMGAVPDSLAVWIAAAGLLAGWLAGRRILQRGSGSLQLRPEIIKCGRVPR
jgi:sigma-E factor negative regulatory protein RseC